jgi:hypothetical protein
VAFASSTFHDEATALFAAVVRYTGYRRQSTRSVGPGGLNVPDQIFPKWTGVVPIAPTPFSPSGDIDPEGQRRVLDCMIDQGVDGICILANYSEQFVLSDAERDLLLDLCLFHVAGRLPIIVTCSHFSTRIAADRARKAHAAGASMLMLMPPYHGALLRAEETAMIEHFARIAEAAPIPIMLQDAPLSGVTLSVPFLVRLAREIPQVCYFKIEVSAAAAKLRSLIAAGGNAVVGPFDGEEAITLMADLRLREAPRGADHGACPQRRRNRSGDNIATPSDARGSAREGSREAFTGETTGWVSSCETGRIPRCRSSSLTRRQHPPRAKGLRMD